MPVTFMAAGVGAAAAGAAVAADEGPGDKVVV
jgi:hypothetical protein